MVRAGENLTPAVLTVAGRRFPSMDASRPARALSRPAFGSRLPPSIRSRRSMTVGPDEFRGPAPGHKRGLFRPWQATGSADPGPTVHAILDTRPRSPWKPFRGGPTRPGLRLGRASLPEPRSRPAPAHAAAARWASPRLSSAQAIRASLFATAAAATLYGRRASSPPIQDHSPP